MQPREPSLDSPKPFNEQALLLEHVNDAAVFYSGKQHGKHLDLLLHLSRYSNLLLTVTGQQGSGKTHLKNRMLQQLDSGVVVSLLDANKTATAAQLLPTLAQNLNIEIPAKADFDFYLDEIRNFSSQLSEEGGSCLIVIDNAENLEQDAINLLLDLATTSSDNQRPHLALFGRQELFTKLHKKENITRFESVGHHLPLEAFNEAEARNYLEHRCNSVGIDHLPLDDQQFTKAYQLAKGLPGLLNTALVDQLRNSSGQTSLAISEVPAKKTQTKTTPKPKKAKKTKTAQKNKLPLWPLLVATLLVVLLIVGYLYKGQLPSSTPDTSLISRSQEIRQNEAEQARAAEPMPEEPALLKPSVNTEPEEQAEAEKQPEPQKQPEPIAEQPSLDLPDDTPIAAAPTPAPKVIKETPKKPAEPKAIPKQVATPKATNKVDKDSKQESNLMTKPANHYTLQMMGSLDEAGVKSFIEAQTTNRSDFSYFEGRYKGQPWYVVVYGDYASRDEALAAIQKLPKSLQKQRPWARSYQSVQEDIRSH